MSYWNHRVVRRTWKINDYEEVRYGIHECYYDDNHKVFACTEEPVGPSGDTPEELQESLKQMRDCLKNPIIDYDDIPVEGAQNHFYE